MRTSSINKVRLENQQVTIPICCICKRLRTSKDTWESFNIPETEEAPDITHGFCPDCVKIHYPMVGDELNKKPS